MNRVWILLVGLLVPLSSLRGEEVTPQKAREYKRTLTLLVKGDRRGEIESLIEELAATGSPEIAEVFLVAGTAIPSQRLYRAAGKALAKVESDALIDKVAELLADEKRAYRQRVLALEAFGRRDDDASYEAVLARLKSPVVHVQLAAIDAARRRLRKEAIPVLIDLFEEFAEFRDRTWYEARVALGYLTGQDYDTVEDWRKFWANVGAKFDPKNLGKKSKGKGATEIKIRPRKESVDFFGEEIFSRNLLFVVDVSGSMDMYDEGDYDGDDVETDRQRLFRAKEQLSRAIRSLPKSANFNIVAYSNRVFTWQKTLQPTTRGSVQSALKFVRNLKPIEATHTDDALKTAFRDLRVDTIVLLSDGAPTKRGKGTRDDLSSGLIREILAWVRDANAGRRIRIDTFGFRGVGEWPQKLRNRRYPTPKPEQIRAFTKFMKDLAKIGGGRYRAID